MEDIKNKQVYLNGKFIITNMREAKIVTPQNDYSSIHINETANYDLTKQNENIIVDISNIASRQ